jgi:hypothetical protein
VRVRVRTYLFRREVFQGHGGPSVHVLVLVLRRAVDHLIDRKMITVKMVKMEVIGISDKVSTVSHDYHIH